MPSATARVIATMFETSTAKRAWHFSILPTGELRFIGSWDGTNFCQIKTASAVADNTWKHYAVSFASGVPVMYINGVLQTQSVTVAWSGGAVAMFSAGVQVMLGGSNPSVPPIDEAPTGAMNNFAMFNKVLSQLEVTELYNSGRPGNLALHSAYANCTNWWRMDQSDTAPTLVDSKNGSASNMTITKANTGLFNQSNNAPIINSGLTPAVVLFGQSYIYDGDAATGTLAIPTAAQIAAEVLDTQVVETGYSVRNAFKLMLAALAGKVSGAPTTGITIRNPNDTKNRITATVDANGNRTAITYDVT